MDSLVKLEVGPDASGDGLRAWKRLLDENHMGVECLDAGDHTRVSLISRAVDKGSMVRTRVTRQRFAKSPHLAKQANEESVFVAVLREGAQRIQQGQQESVLRAGDVFLLEESRPFEAEFASDMVEHLGLQVPKSALTRRIGPIESIAFGPDVPLQKLVATFVGGMVESLDEFETETANRLMDQALDLIALMIAGRTDGKVEPSTHRAGMLLRLKAYVRANLRDETLTIERAAQALGISSRYVNALLATEGTSFGRYVLAERLDGARRAIMDPRHIHRQVTEVAVDWGFRNASHFGRAFKEKYGMSPRDAKHRTS